MQRICLVVSEDADARRSLATSLGGHGIQVIHATDGTEAIRVARSVAVDVVLIVARGPAPGVRALQERIAAERPQARVIPVTSFGSVRSSTELMRFGKDDYLIGAADLAAILERPEAAGDAGSSTSEEVQALVDTLDVLVGLLELGDRFFAGSAHRTLHMCRTVAEDLGLDPRAVDEVTIAALLRDLGKVGVDRSVRDSPDPYTLEQFETMKGHVDAGVRLFEHIDYPWKVIPVIRHHHERYDGRGYPDGLRGREIPLGSRILAVVDAYIALTSERPHRPAVAPDDAIEALEKQAGAQFDPEVVELLIRIIDTRPGMSGGEHGRVLIVDAHVDHREVVELRLLNDGFTVDTADGIDEAFERIEERSPDVMLIDPGPGTDDILGLLRRASDDARLDGMPLVILAQRDDPVLKLRALRQGIDEWLPKSCNLEELSARVDNLVLRERRRASPERARRRGISGSLANLSLPEIVQMLVIGTKTACVRISAPDGKGQIWFREGVLVHATCRGAKGDEAFLQMLRWNDGSFVVEHGLRSKQSTIEADAMYLVMEGLRILDEEGAEHDTAAS